MTSGKRFEDPNQRIEVQKIIIHPGEINCLKCWPRNKRVVATHSDNKNVYIWDIKHQKNAVDRINIDANLPDLL
jgi:WD40 repeat protein